MLSLLVRISIVCVFIFSPIRLSQAFAERVQPLPRPTPAQLGRNAGYIFAGTVTAVTPVKAKKANQVPAVQISFHVDRAIRGVRAGQSLSIREWAGLWQSGERYRVGQKLLLFLYRPSRLGLTSAVGGALGRLPLDAKGNVQPGYGQWSGLPGLRDGDEPGRKRPPMKLRDLDRRMRREGEE